MDKRVVKYLIVIFAYLAVLYPVSVRLKSINWTTDAALLLNLFPVFGLVAFAILWLHALSGVFEPWLRNNFDFDRFVHNTSMLVLVCIILHPLLLFVYVDFNLEKILLYYGHLLYIRLGVVGWLLLITYDIGKALKKYNFFARNWNKILLISTIGFLLTFFHSVRLGSDLQSGPLSTVWLFYGVTAIFATLYTYGIKRIFNNNKS